MGTSSYTLRTLRKGLDVLEAFENHSAGFTLTELSGLLKESPTVVFRLLKTLEEGAYIQQDPASKRYSLGLRVWELGCKVANRMGLIECARPVLKWLTQATGETSGLVVIRDTDIIYVDIVEGSDPVRVYAEPGSRVPLYLTASGKAILAYREAELFKRVVRAGMKRLTPLTITRPSQLRQRLEEIRKTELSLNRGERRLDISAVAAPIFDSRAECVAAVTVSIPTTRFRDDHLENVKKCVRKAAEDISSKLGYHTSKVEE